MARAFGRSPLLRFIFVGAATFVLPLAVAAALREGLSVPDQLAFLIASIVGVEANFVLSFFFTWRLRFAPRAFAKAFTRYHFAKFWTILLAQGLFGAFNALLPFYAAYIAVAAVMSIVNYLLQRSWVFTSGATAVPASRPATRIATKKV